jgi:PAS domain S-box-containing protein
MATNRQPSYRQSSPADAGDLQKIFDEGPLGMAIVDQTLRFTRVNSRISEMLGYTPQELAERTLPSITHPRDIEKVRGPADQLLKGRISDYRLETRLIKKNGRALWLNLIAAAIQTEAGAPRRAVIMMEDIAERKTAEELLRDSEERFRSVAESTPDAVIGCRQVGTEVAFWNRAAEKIFGYSKEEIVGKPLGWILPRHLKEKHYSGVARYLATGEVSYLGGTAEFTALRKNGEEFPIEISLGSWMGREGMSFTSIIRDITVRKRQERLSEALNDMNASINSTLDFEAVLSRVVVEAAEIVGAENTAVSLLDGGRWQVSHAGGRRKDSIGGRFGEDTAPLAALAARLNRPVVVTDAMDDPRVRREFAESYALRSFMLVPLIVKEELIGSLSFNYHSGRADFAAAEIDFAHKLGASISLAVENAKLYQAQSDIANILQEALVTVPERLPGIDLGYVYRSATQAARVGGDFYDIFELEHGKIGVLIGDVSGKGVRAAALTTMVKNTIKAYSFQGDRPSAVLSKANNLINRASGPADFVTLIYLVLDTETGDFTYCNAGHPPPLIKDRTGVRFPSAHSTITGVFPDSSFIEATDRLSPGDLLVLYTDGVIETKRDSELFGEKRLGEAVGPVARPDEAVGAILHRIIEFSDDKLLDDVAILALALKGPNTA